MARSSPTSWSTSGRTASSACERHRPPSYRLAWVCFPPPLRGRVRVGGPKARALVEYLPPHPHPPPQGKKGPEGSKAIRYHFFSRFHRLSVRSLPGFDVKSV